MMKIDQSGYGLTSNGQEYWSTHRSKLSDLYRSESHFFVPTINKVSSILDLGCAAGGSLCFAREANPKIKYTGIDISENLIEIAKKRFSDEKEAEFISFDGENIPVKNEAVDMCFSFGVFHHLSDWKKMALETLRVSNKYVLFDLRVWEGETIANSLDSVQKIALGEEWDGKTVIYYNIQSMSEVMNFVSTLKEQSISSKLYGYYAPPTTLAVTPVQKVLMLALLLEKNASTPNIQLLIE